MFPNNNIDNNLPLQSKLFGHRYKQNQTIFEYTLEFLIVVFSQKSINGQDYIDDLFPINLPDNVEIKYKTKTNIALKRFAFFNKSKQESKFAYDEFAYNRHIEYIKNSIDIESRNEDIDNKYVVRLLQNLLYGFSSVIENRSWFAQSMFPLCKSMLIPEMMGEKKSRNKKVYDEYDDTYMMEVDTKFETNRYNFMCRGGEVYYLHILRAINNYPKYKISLEEGLNKLINQFEEIEKICEYVEKIWNVNSEAKEKDVEKTLGFIPDGFSSREEKTLIELCNILNSDMHPFDKLEVITTGIIIQSIVMCHNQARYAADKPDKGVFIIDINCYKGNSRDEIKKFAAASFSEFEQDFYDALYKNVSGNLNKNRDTSTKTEKETIDSAIDDSLKVYKKLGKNIGMIRPINEKYTRFTINENILKFLVTSVIRPNSKMTLDRFLEKLYEHFNIVVGKEELEKYSRYNNNIDLSFLDINKSDIQIVLKESGFLRELSDSTSIVENPYKEA